jgi:hypothetical protein
MPYSRAEVEDEAVFQKQKAFAYHNATIQAQTTYEYIRSNVH